MNMLQELWAIFVALWNTGNRWLRNGLTLVLFWPIAIAISALIGYPAIVAIVAMIPIMAIVFLFIAFIDPLVLAAVALVKSGRTALAWLAGIVAAELIIGVYFSLVPVWNDRELIPVMLLIAVTFFFLAIGTQGKLKKMAISILTLAVVILTIIFFLGGRKEAKKEMKGMFTSTSYSFQQPAVVEKTCPEDLAKCEPCEGAKNFEWPLDKNGKPLPQLVVDVSATNCWTGYVITPKRKGQVYRTYSETDQYVQFQDGETFLDGPARVENADKRRGIFRFMALKYSGKTIIEIDKARKIF